MTYSAAIVGAAGFAGIELVRILASHPSFELKAATSDALANTPIAKAYPAFRGATDLRFASHEEADLTACDVAFLAVPHTAALETAADLLERGVTVIDLSADFRLEDATVYEQWYGAEHTRPDLLAERAFGLPELFRSDLTEAALAHGRGEAVLVGCAGCYPTATSLAAAPALRLGLACAHGTVIADAISGVTGAGKTCSERTHFCFANENVEAYGVATHRHTPEIEQILGIAGQGRLVFTPHLAPLNRGLLSTVNIPLSKDAPLPTVEELVAAYREFYADSPLVTVLDAGEQPRTASVAGTCRAQIGLAVNEAASMLIATGAIDNLGKGAAGQAVQCANIVFGLPEDEGLGAIAQPV